jgi:hypothetical protein
MHTKFWLESLMGRDQLEDLGIDERIKLAWTLKTQGPKMRTGFIQHRIETSSKLLQTW